MIRFLTLELELQSDVIQTAETSSLGVHHCLEYLKGSSILGAAAAAAYDGLGPRAYTAFHSGQVRFLDAVLLTSEGTPMIPVPLGWLYRKGSAFQHDGKLVADEIYAVNHLGPDEAGRLGLRQIRGGYFSREGQWANVERRYRLKTAIDRTAGGRPDEGRLFGYESLPAGSRWQARIEIDEDVAEEVDESLASVLDDRLVWLGRSRAAEYGRAHVRIAGRGVRTPSALGGGPVSEAAVCLESDAALADPDTGEPTFTARPEHFGLPASWLLDPFRSGVMTRRYSPFNRKRRRRESERLVLLRGSVLTFFGEDCAGGGGADLDAARLQVARGIGMWRQEGLGQVEVAPDYLGSRHPELVPAPAADKKAKPRKPAEPPGPLAAWMLRRCQADRRSELAFDEAGKAADRLIAVVRKLQGKRKLTPGRSQWNKLAGLVRRHLDLAEPSVEEVREEVNRTLLSGVGANSWRAEEPDGKPFLEQTLAAGLGAEDGDASARLWQLCHTAQLMVRRLSQDAGHAGREEERRG